MRALCLDLATQTGWALAHKAPAGETVVSGTKSFKHGKNDGGGMRFLLFTRWLEKIQGETPFDCIYFEAVRAHKGVDAAHVYGGLYGVLTAWCELKQIPYQGIGVGEIKKHFTGKGNADKAAMIHAAEMHGYHPADDNEADAIAIAHYALDHFL